MNELSLNLAKAGIVVVFLLALDFVLEMILIRNIKERRKSLKLRVLLRYVLVFTFFFSMAKIWVEGFVYLLSFIGIIAAALTITQKEYLMNVFGWLIIMWRDLFAEGDYIEVGRYCGFVKAIGPLYFSLEETSDIWGDKTGRIIKVPNSVTATNPVVNFSMENSFIESKSYFIFSIDSSVEKIRELMKALENEVDSLLSSLYGNWTSKQQKQHNQISQFSNYKPQCILRVQQNREKTVGLQLQVRYLSLKQDRKNIEDNIFAVVMKTVNETEELALSTEI